MKLNSELLSWLSQQGQDDELKVASSSSLSCCPVDWSQPATSYEDFEDSFLHGPPSGVEHVMSGKEEEEMEEDVGEGETG